MKTAAITPTDLAASVIAVPPLARHDDLKLDREANRAIVHHLESGGVRSLLYGGNANFYHLTLGEYPHVLDLLRDIAGPDTWVIPSAGPDYGKMMDQAAALRSRDFPTAMVLPLTFPMTGAGVATGIRHFADALGKPVIVYLKAENYLPPATVGELVRDGLVSGIKYAIVREDPRKDPYLRELLHHVPTQLIVSGIGERPAIVHLRDFKLQGFTSGSVCVGPRGSTLLMELIRAQRWDAAERIRAAYIPLEDLRDALSPIRVLHEAVALAGIADTGPMLPLLSNLDATHHARVRDAANALLAHDRSLEKIPV